MFKVISWVVLFICVVTSAALMAWFALTMEYDLEQKISLWLVVITAGVIALLIVRRIADSWHRWKNNE